MRFAQVDFNKQLNESKNPGLGLDESMNANVYMSSYKEKINRLAEDISIKV